MKKHPRSQQYIPILVAEWIGVTMQMANMSSLADDDQHREHSMCSVQHALQFLPANNQYNPL